MPLTEDTARVLRPLAEGALLKSHRFLDGTKVFRLHPLHGEAEEIVREVVEALVEQRLVTSNQKFPAATYLLTVEGRALAASLDPEH
ncbi:MAG: hypothetical protein JW910_06485 [Anaerolineae bacterium]|nr:hypothetical protein [Anaerolineae bacterium]